MCELISEEVAYLIFVHLGKFRKTPDKNKVEDTAKVIADWKEKGVNMLNWYWILGRYDSVTVFEASSEEEAMKVSIAISEWVTSETLVAIPREEAVKLL
jgi:uncharacterized protein with GYD domain